MRALKIKELYFRYVTSSRWALRDVSLEVDEGEFVLITGPSGCGKTTLCRCINGLIPHFYEGEYKGEVVLFEKIKVHEHEPYELADKVGMVFQDPESQLFMTTVEREIAFGLENLGLDREEMKSRVEWVLELLGIEHLRDKAPYELSGGEQQKVAIAAVIAMKPKILVLDEPTANLDPMSALDVINILCKLREEMRITIVIVEHRLDMLTPLVDRIVVIDKGTIIISGSPREVFAREALRLKEIGVEVPKVCLAYKELFDLAKSEVPLTPDEFVKVMLHAKERYNRSKRSLV